VYMKGECAVDDPDGLNIPGFIDKIFDLLKDRGHNVADPGAHN